MQSAIRKKPEEIKSIIARAKAECEPYISMMNLILKCSKITAMVLDNGKISLKYSCEDNENFIELKRVVEHIYQRAQAEINE